MWPWWGGRTTRSGPWRVRFGAYAPASVLSCGFVCETAGLWCMGHDAHVLLMYV